MSRLWFRTGVLAVATMIKIIIPYNMIIYKNTIIYTTVMIKYHNLSAKTTMTLKLLELTLSGQIVGHLTPSDGT